MARIDKFDMQDREVIAMCNARRIRDEAKEAELRVIEAEYEVIDTEMEARIMALRIIGGAAARGSIGLVFLGAVTRGMISPVLGLLGAAVSFLWAAGFVRR